jgi:hypothetical protein
VRLSAPDVVVVTLDLGVGLTDDDICDFYVAVVGFTVADGLATPFVAEFVS